MQAPRAPRVRAWRSLPHVAALLPLIACGGDAPGPDPTTSDASENEPRPAQPPPASGRELYMEHCATCHGPEGAGDGETELAVPARSFQLGNFTWGNTPEALARTVRDGLPGSSPMPPFIDVLEEDEIERVVEHVRSLIPEEIVVDPAETRVDVSSAPAVVRGMLPGLSEDAALEPRGLLLGFPGGLSLEFQSADVQLRALRRGGFVERTDWEGRGGTPLEPLGELALACAPGPSWERAAAAGPRPLSAALRSTWVRGDAIGLEQTLRGAGMESVALTETLTSERIEGGVGVRREFEFAPGAGELYLRLSLVGEWGAGSGDESGDWSFAASAGESVHALADAPLLLTGGSELRLSVELDPQAPVRRTLILIWQEAGAASAKERLQGELR